MIIQTRLPISPSVTAEQFFKAASQWGKESGCLKAPFPVPEQGIKEFQMTVTSHAVVTVLHDEEKKTAAVQIRKDNGRSLYRCWEYVYVISENCLFIRYETTGYGMDKTNIQLRHLSSPEFIKTAIDSHLLAENSITITNGPYTVDSSNIGDVRDYIRKICISPPKSGQKLQHRLKPVIYIPYFHSRKAASCAKELAWRLKGMAHILLPGNRAIHRQLKTFLRNIPLKSGYYTVIFPSDTANSRRDSKRPCIQQHRLGKFQKEKDVVIQEILAFNSSIAKSGFPSFQMLLYGCMQKKIDILDNAITKERAARTTAEDRIKEYHLHMREECERIKKDASEKAMSEAEDIIQSYEEDIALLKEEKYSLDLTVRGLENENVRLRNRHQNSGQIPLLTFGKEKEFYFGEIPDLILSVLEESLESLPDRTRKKDVVLDILSANNYQHIGKGRSQQIKNKLKSYSRMTDKLKSELEDLGFRIEESSNHFKITYFGDKRYTAVFGSTPSDTRCGKNNASRIVQLAY